MAPNSSKTLSDSDIIEAFRRYFTKRTGMPSIAKQIGIAPAELRRRVRDAYRKHQIVLCPPVNDARVTRMTKQWPHISHHVFTTSGDYFFRDCAHAFFQQISDVIDGRDRAEPLRIGLVSGRTTGGMIESICDPENDLGRLMPVHLLPQEICIYALNVSQFDGYDQLKGNANVLAYQLAHRLRSAFPERKVEAYGLVAALLQTKEEAQRTDCAPQTRLVLKYTDPGRLRASLQAQRQSVDSDLPQKSTLDMVITGVGRLQDSLFKQYCEANHCDMDRLRSLHIVGDIAYCPLTTRGEPQVLHDSQGRECVFYAAISPQVLQEMSTDPSKRVILVARDSSGSRKSDAVHAAIGGAGKTPFCSVLLIDDHSAEDLCTQFPSSRGAS